MKKIILFTGILFMSVSSFCTNPPEAVQKAFTNQFAKAANVKWDKENATEYEAEFMLNGSKMSANYSADGTWLETESEIKIVELPVKVKESISKTYPGWEIAAVSKIETSKKGTFYEADLKSGAKKKEVTFTAEGSSVK
jgi:hypothetical protein